MLNRSKLIQRRALHCSLRVFEEWTKAGLRRMKKNDLVQLAKENHLNISGTKNDIIIQLLSHQTAKIVGSTTPTLHSIRKVVDKPDETTTAAAPPLQDTVDADNEWMTAFEMKVAQRGSRKPMSQSREHFTGGKTTSKPHPFNDAVKSSIVKPLAEQVKSTTPPSTTVASIVETLKETKFKTSSPSHQEQRTKPTSDIAEELEGMDPAWVEAFDLKVGSRGARHHLTDTLSPSTPTLSAPMNELPFVKLDLSENKHHPSTTSTTADKHEPPSSNNDSITADQSKNTWINTLVGTSMLAWYFGGEEGISNVWHFLTSSS
ncbi:hypothetical protein MAM1_0040d02847 [Mucor ambiguus]|uniref:SAP domain-containing protein n=1 Tax=Mucor ambiguus TaxID=91626 RepID=A0A0C9M8F0_9FUNG|nr:hypothetical protein MAM1_0040d02847 [Mucor ambiguus]